MFVLQIFKKNLLWFFTLNLGFTSDVHLCSFRKCQIYVRHSTWHYCSSHPFCMTQRQVIVSPKSPNSCLISLPFSSSWTTYKYLAEERNLGGLAVSWHSPSLVGSQGAGWRLHSSQVSEEESNIPAPVTRLPGGSLTAVLMATGAPFSFHGPVWVQVLQWTTTTCLWEGTRPVLLLLWRTVKHAFSFYLCVSGPT